VVKLRGNAGNGLPLPFFEGNAVPVAQVALMGGLAENGRLTMYTSKGSAVDMSECWTLYQLIEKTNTYPWLIVRDKKLSCKTRRNVKNIKTQ